MKPLVLLLLAAFNGQSLAADAVPAAGGETQFNPAFFGKTMDGQALDLSRFDKGNQAEPGTYRADVYVNQSWIGRRDVTLSQRGPRVEACMSRVMMEGLGVDFSKLPQSTADSALAGGACAPMSEVVPGATQSFDLSELKLEVSIPQLYLRGQARGYVDPQYWDAGAPLAGFLSYNANGYRYDNAGQARNLYFLGANAGLNVREWRLRYSGTLSQQDHGDGQGSGRSYQGNAAYVQRDLTDWRAQLTMGDSQTPSDLFSSVSFRGVQIQSDDRMQPESLQGYAPIVRGVADTHAKVSVRQNGNLIYEATVPPGEFKVDDLYNTGYAGDLNVTVTEADGRTKQFVVPYASVPQLLRPDASRYSLLAGRLRNDSLSRLPDFIQGTYQRGLNNSFTGYGGAIASGRYQQLLLGLAFNTPIGAFSADMAQSTARGLPNYLADGGRMSGQSYSVTYSKLLPFTQTNFTVAAYRYSTDGYLELADFARLDNGSIVYRQRSRFQLNVDQPLPGNLGRLFLTGSAQNYWNRDSSDVIYQAGYSKRLSWGSVSLSAGRTLNSLGAATTQYMLSLSLPLGRGMAAPQLTASYAADSRQSRSGQLSLNGTAGEQKDLSYSVYGSSQRNHGVGGDGGGASLQYATSAATFNAAASVGSGSSQQSLGLSGALVFHPGGVTAAQTLGDSIAVIEAKGAEGAVVGNANGVKVGGSGYAVVPSLMPYRANEISLDPKGLSDNVELQTTSSDVVPRAGSIVMLKFPTVQGQAALVRLRQPDGRAIPVGSAVLGGKGQSVALVGQGGWVFLRGLEGQALTAKWGEGEDRSCAFHYQAQQREAKAPHAGFARVEAQCVKHETRQADAAAGA
ncbi:fimbria/pilus outer membrane usher protein [Chromobacterium alticapitis]|nr:fimbria/pilus outer membrane usher protein [Chromobacterium alticapitis]